MRPLGFQSGSLRGHYRLCAVSGLLSGVAAGADLFAFLPASTNYVRALIQRLRMRLVVTTPFTTAQEVQLNAYIARTFSTFDSGGTALTLTGQNNCLNSQGDAPAGASAAIQIVSTAALTKGTYTLDAQPFLVLDGIAGSTAAIDADMPSLSEEYRLLSDQQYPIALQSNNTSWDALGPQTVAPEGLVIQNGILLGAAGAVRLLVDIEWVEFQSKGYVGAT